MKQFKNISLLVIAVLFLTNSFAQKRLKKISEKANNAVFSIVTYNKAGKEIGKACGFFIDTTGRAISKAYIFKGAFSAKVILDNQRIIKVKKLISIDPIANLALFQVKKFRKGFSFFNDEYVNPVLDEEVLILKNVEDRNSKADLGNIRNVVTIEGFGEISEFDQDISIENNGCPIINGKGNLVGIASKDEKSGINFSLNFQELANRNKALLYLDGEKKLPGNKRTKFPPLRDFTSVYIHILGEDYQLALNDLNSFFDQNSILKSDKYNTSVYFLKAFLEKKLNRLQDAKDSYTRILEIDLGNEIAFLERAKVKLQMGDLEAAGKDLEESLNSKNVNKASIKKAQGDLFVQLNNLEKADVLYQEAESMGYNKYELYKERAKIYLELGLYQSAKDILNQAIAINPYDNDLYIYRGEANANLGMKKEAENDFGKSGVMDGSNLNELKSLARSSIQMADFEEAVHALESAIKIDPNDAEVLLLRGKAFNNIQSYEEAKTSLDILIRKDPYLSEAYYQRGKTHLALNMIEESLRDFTKATKLKPDYTGAFLDRGVAYGVSGSYSEALEDFEIVVKLEPNNLEGLYNQGLALYQMKNWPAACRVWSRAAAKNHEPSLKRVEEHCVK